MRTSLARLLLRGALGVACAGAFAAVHTADATAAPLDQAHISTVALQQAATKPVYRPQLAPGAQNSYVKEVQKKLHITPVSGFFGPKTTAAVNAYQRKHKLPVVGQVGARTWSELLGRPVTTTKPATSRNTVAKPRSTVGKKVNGWGTRTMSYTVSRKNGRSAAAAVRWARAEVRGRARWSNWCLAFVGTAYGWRATGVNYAIDHYSVVPKSMRYAGDRNPVPGALLFWRTGARPGHVAIYLGNGMIASNDIRRRGHIDVVPASEIERRWGARYVGWTLPYFPRAV